MFCWCVFLTYFPILLQVWVSKSPKSDVSLHRYVVRLPSHACLFKGHRWQACARVRLNCVCSMSNMMHTTAAVSVVGWQLHGLPIIMRIAFQGQHGKLTQEPQHRVTCLKTYFQYQCASYCSACLHLQMCYCTSSVSFDVWCAWALVRPATHLNCSQKACSIRPMLQRWPTFETS